VGIITDALRDEAKRLLSSPEEIQTEAVALMLAIGEQSDRAASDIRKVYVEWLDEYRGEGSGSGGPGAPEDGEHVAT
tara:strand:+ start:574 stop:804 length:231 start_codon:yes stop_codon:yes gene_type:complete